MFLRILSAVSLLISAVATVANCDPNSRFTLDSLDFKPDPPVAGQDASLTVTYTNGGTEVVGGTTKTSVTLNYIPLSPTEELLCDHTECPIAPGQHTQTSSSPWPTGINGLVVTKIQWFDPDGTSLLCMQIKVNSQNFFERDVNSTEEEGEDAPMSHGFRLPY